MKNNRKLNFIVIISLFLLSAIFRVLFLNLIEFKADQAISFLQIFKFFQNPQLIQVGLISSIGAYNFPFFNYLLIFLSVFDRNPQFLSFIIALINCFLIIFFYIFIKKYYGFKVAIIASLFIATSPWAILFSRSIWAQDLILLFVIPALFLIHQLIFDKKRHYLFLLFILLTLLSQLHSSGIFFSIATIFILFFLKEKIKLKEIFRGICIGLIPAIPYFIFELTSSPFCRDCQALISYATRQPKNLDFQNFLRPFQLLNGSYFQYELGKDFQSFLNFAPFVNILNFIFLFFFVIFIGGVILILKKEKKYKFLIFYFFSLPLMFFISKTPSYIHYFVSLIPVSALIVSLFFSFIIKRNRIIGFFLVFVFLVSNIIFESYFYNYLRSKQQIAGDYGPTYSLSSYYLNDQLKSYIFLPYYQELRNYSFVFINGGLLHQNLGIFFVSKGNPEFAKLEFEKQLVSSPNSSISLSNLAYIYILEKNYKKADYLITKLEKIDKKTANQLKQLIE